MKKICKSTHFSINFKQKICIFLRYYNKSAFFSIARTQTNVIISCSYPEVTFDRSIFETFARLAIWQAKFCRKMGKVAFFGAEKVVFDLFSSGQNFWSRPLISLSKVTFGIQRASYWMAISSCSSICLNRHIHISQFL